MVQIAKGVFDLLPEDAEQWKEIHRWQSIESIIRSITHQYGFSEIRTPIFEKTELFTHSIGNTTDIVTKEMYTFEDKGGRSLTLRPEGTAPVMRAFIEHHLDQKAPVHKLYYILPMFRYERQQAGRYRQHHQFGIEVIGNSSYLQDAECILLLFTLLNKLQLHDVQLQINTVGSPETRKNYALTLKEYLLPFYDQLSQESQERFHKNPLRILDSKAKEDQHVIEGAPQILDFISSEERDHFDHLCATLKEYSIPLHINPLLVRGLDYYNKTVFEVTTRHLGAQSAIGGGGRYDGLLATLGGPNLPLFGFGVGIERLIQLLLAQNHPTPRPELDLYLIPLGDNAKKRAFALMQALRAQGFTIDMDLQDRKLQKSLKILSQSPVRYVGILGDNELREDSIVLKDMKHNQQETLPLTRLTEKL